MIYKKVVLSFFIIVLLFFSCKADNQASSNKKLSKSDSKPLTKDTDKVIIDKIQFSNTKEGKTTLILNAKKGIIYRKKNIADLVDVKAVFPADKITIFSKKGIYYLKTKDADLSKDVKVISKDFIILSDKLKFYDKTNKVVINSPFKLKGEQIFLKGKKLVGFLNKRKFYITGRVHTIWRK